MWKAIEKIYVESLAKSAEYVQSKKSAFLQPLLHTVDFTVQPGGISMVLIIPQPIISLWIEHTNKTDSAKMHSIIKVVSFPEASH